jgi:adenylate cyclase
MDCGAERVGAGRSHWRAINEWQVRCDECSGGTAASSARTACLIFATAEGRQTIDLRSTNSLGRHPKSSVQLLDKIVAKEHCVVERCDGGFIVRDLGSLNGTYVNGERVRGERTLVHGDEIALGATRARYDDGIGAMSFAPPPISPGVVQQPAPPPRERPN